VCVSIRSARAFESPPAPAGLVPPAPAPQPQASPAAASAPIDSLDEDVPF